MKKGDDKKNDKIKQANSNMIEALKIASATSTFRSAAVAEAIKKQADSQMMLNSVCMLGPIHLGIMLSSFFRYNKKKESEKVLETYISQQTTQLRQEKADAERINELQNVNAKLEMELRRMKVSAEHEAYQRMVDNLVRQIECDMISSSERAVVENFIRRTHPELSTNLRLTDVIDEAYRRRAIALKPVIKLEQKVNNFDAPVKTVQTVVNMKSMVTQEQEDEDYGR